MKREPLLLRRAFRFRAGVQSALLSCLCAWPLERADTSTGHLETCPAHRHILSQRVVAMRGATVKDADDIVQFWDVASRAFLEPGGA